MSIYFRKPKKIKVSPHEPFEKMGMFYHQNLHICDIKYKIPFEVPEIRAEI